MFKISVTGLLLLTAKSCKHQMNTASADYTGTGAGGVDVPGNITLDLLKTDSVNMSKHNVNISPNDLSSKSIS